MAATASPPPRAIEVFFSYAHADEALCDDLAKHLRLLERQGVIAGWHDRRIAPGYEWAGLIDSHIQTAQIILLLVSADFLASDYCYDREMHQAMARHTAGDARVIPVILRPADWHSAPFGKLQALPKNSCPVTSWPNQDEAFFDIVRGIRSVVEELTPSSNSSESPDYAVKDSFILQEPGPFKTFGTLSICDTTYVRRNSDYQLRELVETDVFIALEGPSQIGKSSLLQQHPFWLGSEWTIVLPSFEFYTPANESGFNKAFFQELQQIDNRFKDWITLNSSLQHQKIAFLLDELATCRSNYSRMLITRLYKLGSENPKNVRVLVTSPRPLASYMSKIGLMNPKYYQVWKTVKLVPFTKAEAMQLFRCFPDPLPEHLDSRSSEIERLTGMNPNALQRLCFHIWSKLQNRSIPSSKIGDYLATLLNEYNFR